MLLPQSPALASAVGGEGAGGLLALGEGWGLCLSEANASPTLHSGPPALLVRGPGRGRCGLRPPGPEHLSHDTDAKATHAGVAGRGRTICSLHKVSTARGGGEGDAISTAHLLLRTRGQLHLGKALSNSVDIQHGGRAGLGRGGGPDGRGAGQAPPHSRSECA